MIRIDPEFQSLIPPLTEEEYRQLEENILKDGIRDPLVVWPQSDGDSILVDGHNRWNIAAKHGGVNFKVVPMEFESREAVKAWIAKTQLGRRNLDKWQKYDLNKVLEEVERAAAKKRQGTRTDIVPTLAQSNIRTRDAMADRIGVSHGTYDKMKTIDESDNEEVKQAVRNGDMSIHSGYQAVCPTQKREKKNPVADAQFRHAEFKESKVATIEEAKQDNADRNVLARAAFNDIQSCVCKITALAAFNDMQTLRDITKVIDLKDRNRMVESIDRCISILSITKEKLR